MTSPVERVQALADEATALAEDAVILDGIGMPVAALAAHDQALAASAHARKVAIESGEEWLMSLWPG